MCWQQEAGREWLSLRGALEAFQQWHSQPCTSLVLSSLPHQPAHPQDTDHAGHRALLVMSPATLQQCVLTAGDLAASWLRALGRGAARCPFLTAQGHGGTLMAAA